MMMIAPTVSHACDMIISNKFSQITLFGSVNLEQAQELSKSLTCNQHLNTLILNRCNLTNDSLIKLSFGFQSSHIKEIGLEDNGVSDEGFLALLKAVEFGKIEILRLKGNSISLSTDLMVGKHQVAIFKAFSNSKIQTLDLSFNRLGDKGTKLLSLNLALIPSLSTLILDMNVIKNDGAIALSSVLKFSKTLEALSLRMNHITDEGIIEIANGVKLAPRLRVLKLAGNDFREPGLNSLAEALKASKTLQELDLSFCQLSSAAGVLAEGLKENKYLEILDLSHNLAPSLEEAVDKIERAIFAHRTLHTIDLSSTYIPQQKRQKLEAHLARLHRLESKIMVVLTSVNLIKRLGSNSEFRLLPLDLIRKLCHMLVEKVDTREN